MKHLLTRLAKFGALPWPQRRTLAAALAWLPLFWLGLHVLGLRRLQAWLQRPPARTARPLQHDEIVRMAALVNVAAGRTPRVASCLTRSLVLVWMLQRRGVASQLRIGVRLNQGNLAAHAWVEYAGVPINDQANVAEQFAAFQTP